MDTWTSVNLELTPTEVGQLKEQYIISRDEVMGDMSQSSGVHNNQYPMQALYWH